MKNGLETEKLFNYTYAKHLENIIKQYIARRVQTNWEHAYKKNKRKLDGGKYENLLTKTNKIYTMNKIKIYIKCKK